MLCGHRYSECDDYNNATDDGDDDDDDKYCDDDDDDDSHYDDDSDDDEYDFDDDDDDSHYDDDSVIPTTGVCKVTWSPDSIRTSSLYVPASLFLTTIYLGVVSLVDVEFVYVPVDNDDGNVVDVDFEFIYVPGVNDDDNVADVDDYDYDSNVDIR